jgi:hypothetical protein
VCRGGYGTVGGSLLEAIDSERPPTEGTALKRRRYLERAMESLELAVQPIGGEAKVQIVQMVHCQRQRERQIREREGEEREQSGQVREREGEEREGRREGQGQDRGT